MKICSRKECMHCGELQSISNFRKESRKKDKLASMCKDCQKELYLQNKEKINIKRKKYRDQNSKHIKEQKKQSYLKHSKIVCEKSKIYRQKLAKYDTYYEKLSKYENCRRDPKNYELLQIKCFNVNCNNWFNPTNLQVQDRIKAITKLTGAAENHLYCSWDCKETCIIYRTINGNKKIFKKHISFCDRENFFHKELRKLILERDEYTCQKCGKSKKDNPELKLFCHHIIPITQDLVFAADLDNCIALCQECHQFIHSLKGCTSVDLHNKLIQKNFIN